MVRILKSSRKWHMLALPSFVTGCTYFGFEPNRGRRPWSFSSAKSTKRAGTIRGLRSAGFTRRSFGSKLVSTRKVVGWETGVAASAGAEPGLRTWADNGEGAVAAAADSASAAAAGLDTGTAYLRGASLVGLDAAAPMKRGSRPGPNDAARNNNQTN